MKRITTHRGARRASPRFKWEAWDDERLLELRFCELGLTLDTSPLKTSVQELNDELARRGLRHFRPHAWLSSEWFSPDGVPGIALPFYLAHPRLRRLERSMMGTVEGGSADSLRKLLRHEAGHAVDNAYRFHAKARWREVFGPISTPYDPHYRPAPYSRAFVHHLPHWYAQSHPAEDFAETFAVWLGPPAEWRRRYRAWPALQKLEFVDALMQRAASVRPPVTLRERTESIEHLTTTLREHYELKRQRYTARFPFAFDRGLKLLFRKPLPGDRRPNAAAFLRRMRSQLVSRISILCDCPTYTVDQVLHDMTQRSRELNLVIDSSLAPAKLDAALLVAVHTVRFLHTGYHRLAR